MAFHGKGKGVIGGYEIRNGKGEVIDSGDLDGPLGFKKEMFAEFFKAGPPKPKGYKAESDEKFTQMREVMKTFDEMLEMLDREKQNDQMCLRSLTKTIANLTDALEKIDELLAQKNSEIHLLKERVEALVAGSGSEVPSGQ